MTQIKILSEKELRALIKLDLTTVECIENAFRLLATEAVVMPPVLSFHIPEYNGEVDVKTAYVPGIDSFAIKMSPGFFDNPRLGLPSLNGLMVVFAARTGVVEAILLDNGYLTDIRTAAAGAVAAKYLAPSHVERVGVIGSGLQARLQVEAAYLVRPFKNVIVWGRDLGKAEQCAADIGERLGIKAEAAQHARDAVMDSQLVITTTPSTEPLLQTAWLHPNLHITAMGSDADYKCELAPEILAQADVLVVDRLTQSVERGELRRAIAAGVVPADHVVPELGEVISNTKPGRTSDAQITVCDLTGTGIQDTAIARAAFQRAHSENRGTSFDN